MTDNIRFMHIRNFGRKGRKNATVAYTVDDAKQEVRFGFTFCHSNEQFYKRSGRAHAVGRLIVSPMKLTFSEIGSDRYRHIDTFLRVNLITVFGDEKTREADLAKLRYPE